MPKVRRHNLVLWHLRFTAAPSAASAPHPGHLFAQLRLVLQSQVGGCAPAAARRGQPPGSRLAAGTHEVPGEWWAGEAAVRDAEGPSLATA